MILENLTVDMKEPNVIDIKIGRQTWDLNATPEKIEGEKVSNLILTIKKRRYAIYYILLLFFLEKIYSNETRIRSKSSWVCGS